MSTDHTTNTPAEISNIADKVEILHRSSQQMYLTISRLPTTLLIWTAFSKVFGKLKISPKRVCLI